MVGFSVVYIVQKYFYSQNNNCFFFIIALEFHESTFSSNIDFSLQNMIEVRVPNLDCEGCASKLKKALFKLKGTFP